MTTAEILAARERYVMARDNDTEGGLTREGFIHADNEAAEMFPLPPRTLDDLFAEGDPDDSYEKWWI
jgi:hypothetical protein